MYAGQFPTSGPIGDDQPPPLPQGMRSPLLDAAPRTGREFVYMRRITRETGLNTRLAAANNPAVYGLKRIRVGERTGGLPIAYTGCDYLLYPPDVQGSGISEDAGETGTDGVSAFSAGIGTTALPWGDSAAPFAAIIIGVNLPIVPDDWTQFRAPIPGIQNVDPSLLSTNSDRLDGLLEVLFFPQGRFSDGASAPRMEGSTNERIGVHPIALGNTLDVGLVVRRSQIINDPNVSHFLCGFASLTLKYLLTQPNIGYGA